MPVIVVKGYLPAEVVMSASEKMRLDLFLQLQLSFGWAASSNPVVASTIRVPQRVAFTPADATLFGSPLTSWDCLPVVPGRHVPVSNQVEAQGAPGLVLLDGIPLRDPFTGAVNLGEVRSPSIRRVEEVFGGGASAWGNGAEGGVVQFFTMPATGRLKSVPAEVRGGGPVKPKMFKRLVERTGNAELDFSSHGSSSVAIMATEPTERGNWQLLARYFDEHESSLVARAQRGLIDQPAWQKGHLVQAQWRQPAGKDRELSLTWRSFREERDEGTGQHTGSSDRNTLTAFFGSARKPEFSWQASGFVQWISQGYEFGAADVLRTTETPLLRVRGNDSTSIGGSLFGAWRPAGNSRVVVGADVLASEFSGAQDFVPMAQHSTGSGRKLDVGLFGLSDLEVQPSLHLHAGVRLDVPWEFENKLEQPVAGVDWAGVHRRDRLSPSLGMAWSPTGRLTFRAQMQLGFRDPAFGERFFRQGQNATLIEPNALLRTETASVCQAGVEYAVKEKEYVKYRVSALVAGIVRRDPIAALAVAGITPGVFTRRLANLDRIESTLIEFRASWNATRQFGASTSATFARAETWSGPLYRGLEPAQAPSVAVQAAISWHPVTNVRLDLIMDHLGARFADYENLLPLKSATLLGLRAEYAWSERTSLTASVRNAGRTEFQSDRGPSGILFAAAPLRISVGVRTHW